MNKLVVSLVVLMFLLYMRYNLKYSKDYEILQIKPSKLRPELLRELNPIIVERGTEDTQDIVRKALKYMYIYTRRQSYPHLEGKLVKNNARYAIVETKDDETADLEIVNPKYNKTPEDYRSVVVRLKRKQIVIVPMFWRFGSNRPIECTYVHDVFSSTYQSLSR